MPSVSQAASKVLRDAGVSYIFGYPGGEVTSFMEEARQAGIRFVLTKHESPAAFMAGAVGEITGRPGVCISTLGPGATNLVSGVADAFLDRAPMLAITGQMNTRMQSIATHQRLETARFFAPMTKWQTALAPGSAASAMRKAIKVAVSPRPGPVHVEIASDVATREVTPEPVDHWDPLEPVMLAEFNPSRVKRAAEMIMKASRPALLVGLGAVQAEAAKSVRRLAELLGAPIIAPKAKGIIDEDHPLFCGVIEMLGTDVPVSLARQADLLLAVGFDPVELDKPWLFGAPVIHIDSVPNYDGYYAAAIELVGDIASALDALSEALCSCGPRQWQLSEISDSRRALLDLITRPVPTLAAHDIVRIARETMPLSTIATCDVGAHKFLVGQLWTTHRPREFFMSNGLSSMGYGFPTAVAASLCCPDRPVIAFVGDGGMSMYLGEIETAVRLGIRLITVVMCDESLSLIKMNQERKAIPYTGVEFNNPDYARVAECFGAKGYRAATREQFRSALEKAASCGGPMFIHADVDAAPYRL